MEQTIMSNEPESEFMQDCSAPENEADAQAVQDMARRLNAISERDERQQHQSKVCFLVGTIMDTLGALGAEWFHAHPSPLVHLASLLLSVIGTGLMIASGAMETWRRYKSYPADLARLGGVQAIPALFLVWKHPHSRTEQHEAHEALLRLLPAMRAADAPLLTPLARDTMRQWLQGVIDPTITGRVTEDLVVATLKVAGQAGDSSMIPAVEALANMEVRYSDQAKVKKAAVQCLPLLQARCRDLAGLEALFRASPPE